MGSFILLSKHAENKSIRQYAHRALKKLKEFSIWNPVLNSSQYVIPNMNRYLEQMRMHCY